MRALIISTIILLCLIFIWFTFVDYADENLHALIDIIEKNVAVSIQDDDWESAAQIFQQVSEQWHENKKVYSFFFNTSDVMDTDFSIAKAEAYIAMQDVALSMGELSHIKEQLGFLHSNELITLENIF
ncbi:MAG: DUF4363 family protein [Anaerovoracaceae bacterium]